MKTINFFLTILIISFQIHSSLGQTSDILTNEYIIKLSNMGLAPSIIVTKIKTSKCKFDVSSDEALITLQRSKVDPTVISEMMNAMNNPDNIVTDINDPLSPHASGIYYYHKKGDSVMMFQLEPSVVSGSRESGRLAQVMISGAINSHLNAELDGPEARVQIEDRMPTFYFYFEKGNSSLNQSGATYLTSTTSPNEFILIRADQKLHNREFSVGQGNVFSASSGVSSKNKEGFRFDKIQVGLYRVYFTEPLEEGEYAFMYASATAQVNSTTKVFDFGLYSKGARQKEGWSFNSARAKTYGNNGYRAFENGEFDKCIEQSQNALKYDSTLYWVKFNIAVSYLAQNNPKFYSSYIDAISSCKKNPDAKELIGDAIKDINDLKARVGTVANSDEIIELLNNELKSMD